MENCSHKYPPQCPHWEPPVSNEDPKHPAFPFSIFYSKWHFLNIWECSYSLWFFWIFLRGFPQTFIYFCVVFPSTFFFFLFTICSFSFTGKRLRRDKKRKAVFFIRQLRHFLVRKHRISTQRITWLLCQLCDLRLHRVGTFYNTALYSSLILTASWEHLPQPFCHHNQLVVFPYIEQHI